MYIDSEIDEMNFLRGQVEGTIAIDTLLNPSKLSGFLVFLQNPEYNLGKQKQRRTRTGILRAPHPHLQHTEWT